MVSTGAKVAIGVGAATAAIGVIYFATKAKAASGFTCLSPDVKENLLGQCPSGYQPDPTYIGCCEPVTTPPPSTCGCASPDVCPDSSGSCPSGYQADSANPGCCKSVSPPPSSTVQVTFVANFPGASITVGGITKTANSSGDATFTLNADTPYQVKASKTVCQQYSATSTECCFYAATATYTTSAAATETVDVTLVKQFCRIV